MKRPLPPEIEALESRVAAEPESASARSDVLVEYARYPELASDSRRIAHVRWLVERCPRHWIWRTPFVLFDSSEAPEEFRAVEETWEQHFERHPRDPEIAIGAALFVATRDRSRAVAILESLLAVEPTLAEVWFHLGRITTDPKARLERLLRARSLGSTNPNLTIWIGEISIRSGDLATANGVADELLELVDDARATYGDELGWPERGRELWHRAISTHPDRDDATRVVRAISAHADHKHWAHTLKGLIALREGDGARAATHLRESAEVVGSPRLSSYGPATQLARELCERGMWNEVAAYLEACGTFWDDERRLRWKEQAERGQMPEFPDE